MESNTNYSEDLKIIKKIMEESSRFLSLSGLSGILTGLIALIGAFVAYFFILDSRLLLSDEYFSALSPEGLRILRTALIADLMLVLISAIVTALYFSYRKSLRQGLKFWTPVSKRLVINVLVPLITGGIFIIIICYQDHWQLIVPGMLIFYGLALVNAGKFTYSEVFYLGLIEILTGLLCIIFPSFGLLFWSFGFGILHIIYGLILYRKYEG